MKNFLKTFFASVIGAFFAMSIVIFLLIAVITLSTFSSTRTINESPVLLINLSGLISEREYQDPLNFISRNFGIKSQGLNDILNAIKAAKEDEKIKGICIKAGITNAGIASMEQIRNALIDFKTSGKFLVAYGETISQKTYFAASVADRIFLNTQGMLEFRGLGAARQYSKGIFDKAGIKMQVFKVGEYKSYIEPYTQTKMSDFDREQRSEYLHAIWGKILKGISESRNVSTDSLNRYADEYLLFTAPQKLIQYGLVDSLVYKTEFENYIKELAEISEEEELKFAQPTDLLEAPYISKDKIAVVYAEGQIVGDVESELYSGSIISPKKYIKEFSELQKDSSVKAVVLRVNSGGGSAFAADQIWHAVKELAKVKPVIASMGDYAASGGYYIVCGASTILTMPTTLTGSIGIFGMFPSGEELAKKMGASFDGIGTNKHTLLSEEILSVPFLDLKLLPARELNEEEHLMLQGYVERGYDDFISRCAEGRGLSKEKIDSLGRGRVWSGEAAVSLKLADKLGDLDSAISLAAELAGLQDYFIEERPTKKDFFEQFMEEIFGMASEKVSKIVLGEEIYKQKQLLKSLENWDYRQATIWTMEK